MRLFNPASRFTLIQQWMTATVLAVIPLLIAVSYAAYALQQQTQMQRAMVENLDLYTQRSNAVSENIRELVRLARQYQLIGDASFLDLYQQKLKTLNEHVDALNDNLPGDDFHEHLKTLSGAMASVAEQLTPGQPVTDDALSPHLQVAVEATEQLTKEVNNHRRGILKQGEQDFNRIIDQLVLFTLLALPGTLLIMLVGNYMVSRPIWRLSLAIRSLGTNNWDTPINIHGPSDLTALGENLEWMRQQVLHGEQQKTAFIQHVTHELKTPLAAIVEAGNLLNEEIPGPLSKGQGEILHILRNNSHALQGLIEQLLNYNAVSYGIMTQLQAVPIRNLCETIKRDLETAFPNKKIFWQFIGIPDQVTSDPRLLEMILKNLIGNGFQFSPDQGQIRVTWAQEEQSWQLTVSDQGPGIEDDEMHKIFIPFYKGKTGREDKIPKNGIGLAIVSESVALLKGSISVTSEISKGTTFTIVFPIERSN